MNKIAVFIALPLLFAACQASRKEELRRQLVRDCQEKGLNSGVTGEMKTIYDKLCTCNAEQITDGMSTADYKAIEKLKQDGKPEEAAAKLQPFIQSCIEEWQKESEAAAANVQPADSVGGKQ